jgi:hypothetical protein
MQSEGAMKFRMKFSLCFWLLLALCTAWGMDNGELTGWPQFGQSA